MADTFTASMAGLRGPGLTGADRALLDAKIAAGDAQVLAAKQAASVASDAAGINRTFATKADANAALAGLANGLVVQVLKDESQNTARTAYKVNAGAFALIGKIAYVADDLSNVSQTVVVSFMAQKLNGGIGNSPYLGGVDSAASIKGLVAAGKATNGGEHRLINYWDGNNSASIQNLSNSDGYSAWRFLDYQGREMCALGYGNPGGTADLPFRGSAYFETSNFINADGSSTPGPIIPMRFVQTGLMVGRDGVARMGVYGRSSHEVDGSWNFFSLSPTWSLTKDNRLITFSAGAGFYSAAFRDLDDLTPILRVRSKNGFEQSGIVIGTTAEGNGTTQAPPQARVDAVGTVLAGKSVDTGRATEFYFGGQKFPFCAYDGDPLSFRHVRAGVGKYDVMFLDASGGKPLRYALVDRDHADLEALWVAMDGTGRVAFNGAAPATIAKLPAALPIDGTATNAAMATMLNAIRASLIGVGLNLAA